MRDGVCPASIDERYDGVHGGECAGRACWMVAGTFCGGPLKGSRARKHADCKGCGFYEIVRDEEGGAFIDPEELREMKGEGSILNRRANKGYDLSFLEPTVKTIRIPTLSLTALDDTDL